MHLVSVYEFRCLGVCFCFCVSLCAQLGIRFRFDPAKIWMDRPSGLGQFTLRANCFSLTTLIPLKYPCPHVSMVKYPISWKSERFVVSISCSRFLNDIFVGQTDLNRLKEWITPNYKLKFSRVIPDLDYRSNFNLIAMKCRRNWRPITKSLCYILALCFSIKRVLNPKTLKAYFALYSSLWPSSLKWRCSALNTADFVSLIRFSIPISLRYLPCL